MKLTVPAKPFADAVQWAAKHARPAGGDASPVWTGLHLEAREDTVVLRATTLDVWATATVAATVHDGGVTVLPAKLVAEVAGRLRGDEVTLTLDGTTAVLECGALRLETRTMDAEGWRGAPALPEVLGTVAGGALRRAVERVSVAIGAPEQGLPELTGVLVTADDDLRIGATNTYQVAEAVLTWQPTLDHDGPVRALVARDLVMVAKDLPKGEDVTLYAQAGAEGQSAARFGLSWPGRTVIAATIAVKPRPIRAYLDRMKPVVTVECDCAELADALAQVGPTVDRKAAARVVLRLSGDELELAARSGAGETSTTIAASYDGPQIQLVANWGYLRAAVASADGARTRIGLMSQDSDPVKHAGALVTAAGDANYRHMVGLLRKPEGAE